MPLMGFAILRLLNGIRAFALDRNSHQILSAPIKPTLVGVPIQSYVNLTINIKPSAEWSEDHPTKRLKEYYSVR